MYAKTRQVDKALNLASEMRLKQVKLDNYTYGTLLNACSKVGSDSYYICVYVHSRIGMLANADEGIQKNYRSVCRQNTRHMICPRNLRRKQLRFFSRWRQMGCSQLTSISTPSWMHRYSHTKHDPFSSFQLTWTCVPCGNFQSIQSEY